MKSNTPLTVVLPTLNGARFLQVQLDSITAQQRRPDLLIVSDDGSRDESCVIIRHFADHAPFQVVLLEGERNGLSANIRSLLAVCPAGHVALADQDDVWLPHKLAQACVQLKGTSKPTLYAARRIVTDAALKPSGLTKVPRTRPSFSHALHRNIAPGNTVVLNLAAQALARRTALAPAPLPAFYGWWLY
jgi:glycosyltransferase involved in cell wall biosynthesis